MLWLTAFQSLDGPPRRMRPPPHLKYDLFRLPLQRSSDHVFEDGGSEQNAKLQAWLGVHSLHKEVNAPRRVMVTK